MKDERQDNIQKVYEDMFGMETGYGKKKSDVDAGRAEDSLATSGKSGDVLVKQLMKIPDFSKLDAGKQNQILAIMRG